LTTLVLAFAIVPGDRPKHDADIIARPVRCFKLGVLCQGFRILAMQRKKLIRGFRGTILIPIWAFAFAGLEDACLAREQLAIPHAGTGTGIIPAPGTPNSAAGPRGQLGITNKNGESITPGERQHTNDCAAGSPAGGNGTACPPAKDAKGINTPGGGAAGPAPTRKASPCIGYPDRQCL
jgi:hypothetical protein